MSDDIRAEEKACMAGCSSKLINLAAVHPERAVPNVPQEERLGSGEDDIATLEQVELQLVARGFSLLSHDYGGECGQHGHW
jgi:hypothetical protein